MNAGINRRKFIITGGSIVLLLPLVQYCKSNKKTEGGKEKKNKDVVRKSKKHKPAITAAMVTNRGWYKNKKNGKIHYFDSKGYTPSLEFLKDKKEFDGFVQHLEPWDSKQITLDIYHKNISKKKKDWIAENAALAFIGAGNYAGAATIVKERIEKRPANLRLWDLLAIMSIRANDEQVKGMQQQLVAKYSNSNEKRLVAHLAKFEKADWAEKMKSKELTWNNQKI